MKHLILFFLILTSLNAHSLTVDFQFLNDGASDLSKDTVVNLGWMTSTALCNDQGLRPLSQLKESTITNDIAHCYDYLSGSNRGVDLSLPITAKVLTDTPLAVQFTAYSEGSGSDFQVFNLKVGRTGSFSGGTPAFNSTYTMVNNDQWDFQLDIRAVIAGPQAKEHYVNGILITITPL